MNTDRVVGTITGAEVSRQNGQKGYQKILFALTLRVCGAKLSCFLSKGMTFTVVGDTNDYCGKGLSGAKVIVRPPEDAPFTAHENIITVNLFFYGATA